ncbi:PAS domain S-box protein [Thermomonas sp. HDW16]|uniref:sensor histidine kinase n=1 Tax=Thermomonas sp. HDW16 TaxID=2714945 RepID=UPI00140B2514|nr:PAS domain S-box protein [Thermomonas sp. HDW16]QIL19450.1 PAS domain S-box protein [Thermomonas sp. HDW16]
MPPHQADDQDEARFRLAMASAGIGMAIVSLEGRFVDVNPALCRMLGRDGNELVGLLVHDISHPVDLPLSEQLRRDLMSGAQPSVDAEKRYLHRDGHAIDVLLNAALMRDATGAPRYFISQFRDVTAQRTAERELRDLNEHLEERVRERTAALEAAQRRLEVFAHGVSHDLRAPLRTIDGFAMQLERNAGDALDAPGREQLARIRSASARMGSLIESLLELARIGRAQLRPGPVDVSLLAEWAAAELHDMQPDRATRIHVQPGLEVIGDERLLKILLTQLLRNAWQFSASREIVAVEVEGVRDDHGLHFVVRDHGIGFDMAYAGKLFEPFQRLHSGEQGAGDGIGLTIAQQIVGRHHGGIRAEAVPDAGASFHVELRDLPRAGDGTQPDDGAMGARAA